MLYLIVWVKYSAKNKGINSLWHLSVLFIMISMSQSLRQWKEEECLDSNQNMTHKCSYLLKWDYNLENQMIYLRIEVRTKSWFSLGFSNSYGKADVLVGWFYRNSAFIEDCTLRNNSVLSIDQSQDWQLLLAEKNKTHIIFEVNRSFKTCDENDIEISQFSEELISYSFGNNIIKSFTDFKSFNNIGTKKMHLIRPRFSIKENLTTMDFFINATIPAVPHLFLCRIFKIEKPTHIVQFIPEMSVPGLIHHIGLYICDGKNTRFYDEYSEKEYFNCDNTIDLPDELKFCIRFMLMWNPGNDKIGSNSESAYVVGDKVKYIYLQHHYTNTNLVKRENFVSGLRALVTSRPRSYELSLAVFSSLPSYPGIIIPPNKSTFTIAGHCLTECFNMKPGDLKFIKLIAVNFHAHSLGRRFKLRHFRNGKELPWIYYSDNYIYTQQLYDEFIEPVMVLGGDQITVECTFDSTNRNYTTIGGESLTTEMCSALVTYYPKVDGISGICGSRLTEDTLKEITGIEEISGYAESSDALIKSPQKYANTSLNQYLINKVDWSESLENKTRFNPKVSLCYWAKDSSQTQKEVLVSYPIIESEFQPTDECQKNYFKDENNIN